MKTIRYTLYAASVLLSAAYIVIWFIDRGNVNSLLFNNDVLKTLLFVMSLLAILNHFQFIVTDRENLKRRLRRARARAGRSRY